MTDRCDFDWLVVGSGFGGSVSALRLAEKGYRVGVLEAGRRFRDEDFAESTWQLRRFLWAPFIGLRGIFRLTPFKDVFIASGSAVGGGSVVYANTLYRAAPAFFTNPQWRDLGDWASSLAPHYDTAERMLGVNEVQRESDGQKLLQDIGRHFGVGHTFRRTPVGVFFGKPGTTVPDPYFGGEGPERTGCTFCGACMVGCREGAKNTLLKNYLWFAEKRGATILPEREVVDIRPLGAADGSEGYAVTTQRPGAWFRRQRRTFTTRGVVVSAGALGTNRLQAHRVAAAHQRPARPARAHEQRVGAGDHPAEGHGSAVERRRHQRQHPPQAGHPHRVRDLWATRRLHVVPVHAAHR